MTWLDQVDSDEEAMSLAMTSEPLPSATIGQRNATLAGRLAAGLSVNKKFQTKKLLATAEKLARGSVVSPVAARRYCSGGPSTSQSQIVSTSRINRSA